MACDSYILKSLDEGWRNERLREHTEQPQKFLSIGALCSDP